MAEKQTSARHPNRSFADNAHAKRPMVPDIGSWWTVPDRDTFIARQRDRQAQFDSQTQPAKGSWTEAD